MFDRWTVSIYDTRAEGWVFLMGQDFSDVE
jgi:hypothetical protein